MDGSRGARGDWSPRGRRRRGEKGGTRARGEENVHEIFAVLVQASDLKEVEDVMDVGLGKAVGEDGAGEVGVAVEVEVVAGQELVNYTSIQSNQHPLPSSPPPPPPTSSPLTPPPFLNRPAPHQLTIRIAPRPQQIMHPPPDPINPIPT